MDQNKDLTRGIIISMRKFKEFEFQEIKISHIYMSKLVGVIGIFVSMRKVQGV